MNAGGWRQVDKLFQAVLEVEPASRAAYLDKTCAGDAFLRSEVDSLLTADSLEWDFIETPALESAALLLVDEQLQFTSGQQIGHYEIVSLIGRGGMGEVYLAKDQILSRMIALKLLPLDYTQDTHRLHRFQREARTVSALNHPNIITIHELGSIGDQQFIATEFVEGETLRSRIARETLSVEDALDVAIQTASALAASHRAGIVHRDIKPENIMLRPDGYVKVLDFGLAKLAATSEARPDLSVPENTADSSGLLLGTVRYMSPEQVSGLPVDARSDIFSLGVVLYEMVTARRPFDHKNQVDLVESILKDDPPPLGSIISDKPDVLAPVLARMLSKNRRHRYQTAEELISDLRHLRDELLPEASGQKRSRANHQQVNPVPDHRSHASRKNFGSLARQIGGFKSLVGIAVTVALACAIGYASYKFLRVADISQSGSPVATGTWAIKAPISSPRWQASPTVLNDVLYVVGGWKVCSPFGELEQYDPGTDMWTRRAPMLTPRGGHGVGALDGKIYAVGGTVDCDVHIAGVEAYDPVSDSWSVKAPLPSTRFSHVVAVANGKLYAIGGNSIDGGYLSLNNQYDPQTDTWTERAPMPTPRSAAAVAVVNGIIYVIGGGGYGGTLATVEAYDPGTDSWTLKRPMIMSRVSFAATHAGDVIYVFGGRGGSIQVETYDPAADAWDVGPPIPTSGTRFHAATLRDSIYLVGGSDGVNYSSNVIAFTPGTGAAAGSVACPSLQTIPRAGMPTERSSMTVGEINGIVYVAGGYNSESRFLAVNEAYDPVADIWSTKAPMSRPRETRGSHVAAVDGKLYVIGGNAEGRCSSLNEAYDPVTDSWMTKAPMPTPRCHLAVVALGGLIYALGGTNTSGAVEYNLVEVYNPTRDFWTTATPMPTARQDLGAAALNGIIYAVGGGNPALNPTGELNVVEAYDPISKTWTSEVPMQTPRTAMAVGVLNGRLVVIGGVSDEKASGTIEAYDPKVRAWTTFSTASTPRSFLTAVTMNDTIYAIGGNGARELNGSVTTNEAIYLKPCSN